MSETSEGRRLAELHVACFNERNWDRAAELYAPDLVVVEPGGTVHGIEGYLAMARGFITAFPNCRMEVSTITGDGDRAAVEGTYTGTHNGPLAGPQGEVPATGRDLRLPLCIIFDTAAGRIAAVRPYYDQMAFATQLGLVPAAA